VSTGSLRNPLPSAYTLASDVATGLLGLLGKEVVWPTQRRDVADHVADVVTGFAWFTPRGRAMLESTALAHYRGAGTW